MTILSILHLPVLFLNTLGVNDKMGLSVSAALTTFGNLGSAIDVGSVGIPGCDETEFQFRHCEIGKFDLPSIVIRSTPCPLFPFIHEMRSSSHIYFSILLRQEQACHAVRLH